MPETARDPVEANVNTRNCGEFHSIHIRGRRKTIGYGLGERAAEQLVFVFNVGKSRFSLRDAKNAK